MSYNRVIEEPKVVKPEGPGYQSDSVTTHPAFGMLSVSRISGRTNLFGSDFSHNGYVVLRLHGCELHRSLSNDHFFADHRPKAEIAMSEAQWATFVSSFNMQGVPCTIESFDGKRLPELPDPKSRADQFGEEMEEDFEDALVALDNLRAALIDGTSGLSNKKAEALLKHVTTARAKLTSSAKFVADQFGEHMEGEVERAKIEIHGYAQGLFQRAGVAALAAPGGPIEMPTLEDKSGGE